MKIISISGLDGSGKSTQVESLKQYLESKGHKVFYLHAIQFSIANLGRKSRKKRAKSVTTANWLQIQLRKLALIIDLCRFKKLLLKLKKQGYDYIVSDRYFYDSVLNIAYLENRRIATFMPKIPKPTVGFYLKVDPEVIMKRPRPADQGIKYLKTKKYLLDSHASLWGLTFVDGNRKKLEIFKDIIKAI